MTNYKQLAIIYLKSNRKRTVITIIGVVITVAILYCGLNVALNYYDDGIKRAREQEDYEICFYTETKEQLKGISNDEAIRSAYIGTAYDYQKEKINNSVLYVNTKHPYSMMKTKNRLEQQYGVSSETNENLEMYYLAMEEVNGIFVVGVSILWLAFIFAIIGVGIIRNSIQLNTLEQIKDFGILRCIGGTKMQLRYFVYIMGFILEMTGVAIGVFVGYGISIYICYMRHVSMQFHVLPVLLVVGVFLFDLFFVMQECCKFVNDMTPVSAVRGEFRIRKEKIKIRNSYLIKKLFGVEGEYAYKSLRRNPGRFWKSVGTIGIGIAAIIIWSWLGSETKQIIKSVDTACGYYQLMWDDYNDASEGEKTPIYLGKKEIFEQIKKLNSVKEIRLVYQDFVTPKNLEDITQYMSEELMEEEKELIECDKNDIIRYQYLVAGLDEEELKEYQPELLEGTLELSENGILAVGQSYTDASSKVSDQYLLSEYNLKKTNFMTCKLGDEIQILDPVRFQERLNICKKERPDFESMEGKERRALICQIQDEMEKAEEVKTYVVEGIIDGERLGHNYVYFLTKLSTYYDMTNKSEKDMNGIKIHVDMDQITESDISKMYNLLTNYSLDNNSYFIEDLFMFENIKKFTGVAVMIVLFVVSMAALNIINTTASSLHLRRKEFAQLRVIGLSKSRLIYTVMLEGIMTTIGANVVGNVIGFTILAFLYPVLKELYPLEFVLNWQAILICLIASGLLLCGSVYVPLRELPVDMASDLTTDGD